jgi:hypothetical protein
MEYPTVLSNSNSQLVSTEDNSSFLRHRNLIAFLLTLLIAEAVVWTLGGQLVLSQPLFSRPAGDVMIILAISLGAALLWNTSSWKRLQLVTLFVWLAFVAHDVVGKSPGISEDGANAILRIGVATLGVAMLTFYVPIVLVTLNSLLWYGLGRMAAKRP